MSLPPRITGRSVAEVVAAHNKLTFADLCGPRRSRAYARPRQFAMYAIRQLCPHISVPGIGRLLGNRDHTTVLHGIRVIEGMIAEGEFVGALDHIHRWFDETYVDAQIVEAQQRLNCLHEIRSRILQVAA